MMMLVMRGNDTTPPPHTMCNKAQLQPPSSVVHSWLAPPHIVLQVWVAPKHPFHKHEIYPSASFEMLVCPKLGVTGWCHISALCCSHGLSSHKVLQLWVAPKKPFRKHEIYSSASFEIWCAPKLVFTGLCHISILCCTHGLSPTYCVAGVGGPKSILFKNIEVARKPFLQFL